LAGLRRSWQTRTPLSEILAEGSTFSRNHLKCRLFDEGVKRRQCELCGQGEEWRGATMALILDHINGVPDDHRLENLRIVCPNCAATLKTHCGRKNMAAERDCARCGSKFRVKYPTHRYCSAACGTRWDRAGRHGHSPLRGVRRPARRLVERPPYDQLIREIKDTSYSAVGRKYGVSDNAIRKWVRFYERERLRAERPEGGGSAAAAA